MYRIQSIIRVFNTTHILSFCSKFYVLFITKWENYESFIKNRYIIEYFHERIPTFDVPEKIIELAKTGDAEKRMILAEYGLKVKNEAALGVAADLTAS